MLGGELCHDLAHSLKDGVGPLGVGFLEACYTDRVGMKCLRCHLPLEEIFSWVDGVNIL